eukprot:GHVQ01032837.1.p1 GENE.GHVQ01032837.1~~GHVQ01032837.1.p1  ORF type:complete len:222 (+),score=18.06 GHVQ01032837.1:100-765(+)
MSLASGSTCRTVEANLEVLQNKRSLLCPRIGPQPLLLSSACSLNVVLPSLRCFYNSLHDPDRSQGNLLHVLLKELQYTGESSDEHSISSEEDEDGEYLMSRLCEGSCHVCGETEDQNVAVGQVKLDSIQRIAWVDDIMVSINSLTHRSVENLNSVQHLSTMFLTHNGWDVSDNHILQQTLDTVFAMRILSKEIPWVYRSKHCGLRALLDKSLLHPSVGSSS